MYSYCKILTETSRTPVLYKLTLYSTRHENCSVARFRIGSKLAPSHRIQPSESSSCVEMPLLRPAPTLLLSFPLLSSPTRVSLHRAAPRRTPLHRSAIPLRVGARVWEPGNVSECRRAQRNNSFAVTQRRTYEYSKCTVVYTFKLMNTCECTDIEVGSLRKR